MKKLIFLLVLIPFLSFGQTDNYAFISSNSTWMNADDSKAFVYEIVADTVMSTDTLLITIPGKFGARYKATFICELTDYGTDDSGNGIAVKIYGAACSTCQYVESPEVNFGSYDIGDGYYGKTASDVVEMPFNKIQIVATCEQCIMNGHLVLKPLK